MLEPLVIKFFFGDARRNARQETAFYSFYHGTTKRTPQNFLLKLKWWKILKTVENIHGFYRARFLVV